MGDKSVTREEFREAYKKAQDDFMKTMIEDEDTAKDKFGIVMMGLHNAAFASQIEKFLFGDEPTKEDTTIDE